MLIIITGPLRITRGIISIYNLQTDDLFLASDSEPAIYVMSGFAGHIDSWLATARQEKIVSLKGLSGYNPSRNTRETCSDLFLASQIYCVRQSRTSVNCADSLLLAGKKSYTCWMRMEIK